MIRPAVMFGLDDRFLNTLIKLLCRLPIYPMFGWGETRLQPADVEDVAEAVAMVMQRTDMAGLTVECGGPRIYSYEELLRTIARSANVKPILVPVPFAAWQGLAWIAERLPGAPVTRNGSTCHAATHGTRRSAFRGVDRYVYERVRPGMGALPLPPSLRGFGQPFTAFEMKHSSWLSPTQSLRILELREG